MVQLQLCTLQQLMDSGFGRPYPRHGLQLLFWFANNCLTCEPVHFVSIMKLVSDCQPEKGVYGFHLFGNVEEILPVLRNSRKGKKYVYFEVGNLNAETHHGSADLPTYVRENYELEGSYRDDNIDRLIIGYHVRTREVKVLFVTEHDAAAFGRFRPDRTYQISWDLVRLLQNPELDLSSFLTQVGYYEVLHVDAGAGWGQYQDPELVFNMFMPMTQQNEAFGIFPETFNKTFNIQPSSYNQQGKHFLHVRTHSYKQPKPRQLKANKRIRSLHSWTPHHYSASWPGAGHGGDGGGGIGLIRLLLGVGALYLAAKCLSWFVKSWWEDDVSNALLKTAPWRTPSFPRTHIMLDYVY